MLDEELSVLLLEDNPGDAFLLKFYLSESAAPVFKVTHAETLQAALELLQLNQYDIILSDMNVPDSFGVDTIKTILTKFPGNMLIVLTGLTDEAVGLETVRFGAQDFLVKGKFDGHVLISSLVFAIERFRLNDQIALKTERFYMLQKLTNTGYFEINIATETIFLTEWGMDLTNSVNREPVLPLDTRLSLFEEHDQMRAIVEEAKIHPVSGEMVATRKVDGMIMKIQYESIGNKLYGTLRV